MIKIIQDDSICEYYNNLTKGEKILTYFLRNASIPFNYIYRDQNHRLNNKIIDMIYNVWKLTQNSNIHNLLIELLTHQGIYITSNYINDKINFSQYITKTELEIIIHQNTSNISNITEYQNLIDFIYSCDEQYMICPNSISKSNNNLYSRDMTNDIYNNFANDAKQHINAFVDFNEDKSPLLYFYSINGNNTKYSKELESVVFWLNKAINLIRSDKYNLNLNSYSNLALCLDNLVKYFETGNEDYFKIYSELWTKDNSVVGFNAGFIETYFDPMNIIGSACAEITIQKNIGKNSMDYKMLEKSLCYDEKYKRDEFSISNVQIVKMLYGSGFYGPMVSLQAYCLPNYDDLKKKFGTKQIIYDNDVYYKHDNNIKPHPQELMNELWNTHIILHETIGHSSGKFYEINESIYNEQMENKMCLEELRAELVALYCIVKNTEYVVQNTQLKNFLPEYTYEDICTYAIIEMTEAIFRKYKDIDENIISINGAHTQANIILTNYLLATDTIEISSQKINLNIDATKNVQIQNYWINVIDLNKCIREITNFINHIQKCKSDGNIEEWNITFNKYLYYPITLDKVIEMSKDIKTYEKLTNNNNIKTRMFYDIVMVKDKNNNEYVENISEEDIKLNRIDLDNCTCMLVPNNDYIQMQI